MAAQRIAQGDYSQAVRGGGDDELGYLAHSFNTMTSELQLAHTALRESADELERKVEERTAELKRMQAQMIQSEKMVAIGKLAAGVAHEINNPLTGVLTNSSLMLEDLADDHPWREDIQTIVNETLRCRKIVKGLLDFSRQTRPQRTLLDLNQVVEDTLSLVRNQTVFRNTKIVYELDPHLPTVLADADQMRQVVLNIVLNAAEAMVQGGELRLASASNVAKKAVELRISDTGPGIPDEVRARIFEPFFTTKKTGTGLGLAICRRLAGLMGGEVTVQSTWGSGSTFTFVLPQMHERKGEKDWGMLRRDYSARPAFTTFAAMTKELGPARYLGQPDLGSGIRAFLFARDDGAQTLVFWSESELDRAGETAAGYTPNNDYPRTFALPASGNAVLADFFGTPQTVTPREGQLQLTANRYPTYLTGAFQLPVKTPPVTVGTAGARQSKIDKSIVLRVIPSADFTINGARTALLLKAGAQDRKIKLEVANLSNDAKQGELTAAGIAVTGLPVTLTLNPFEVKTVELELPPGLPMRLHELTFGGTFNNHLVSKLVLPVVPLGTVTDSPVLVGSLDPAKWRANSSGKMNIVWDEKEQAVRFDVDFAPNIDRWVYPEFVPQGGFPANAAGLSFEIKSCQSKEQTALSLVMLVKEAGKGADSLNYTPSYGNWQDNFIELASHSPETLRLFRIGVNPRQDHLTFWIRNVRLHLIE